MGGPGGEAHQRMIELCLARRAGTPDEVGPLGALLMGPQWWSLSATSLWMAGTPPSIGSALSLPKGELGSSGASTDGFPINLLWSIFW